MKNKKRLILLLLAVLAVGGALWWWLHRAPAAPANQLTLYGNVDIRQVELAFNGSERIAAITVQEGDRVHKGQRLASLDTKRLGDAVDRAAAQLHAQQAVVAKLEAGSRPEEIRKARADLAAATSEADNAARTAGRLQHLRARNLASKEQADNARSAADAARARERAAREALNLVQAGPRQEDIEAAKATLRADQAQLALARRFLADAHLYAPADGVIRDRILEPGDMASPQRPVLTLALTSPVWVRAYVPEPDMGKIRPGMSAQITTDSYPHKRYRGWIGYISPTAEFTPKSVETTDVRTQLVYQVRVFACNPQGELRLGMPATVHVTLGQSAGEAAEPCPGQAGG